MPCLQALNYAEQTIPSRTEDVITKRKLLFWRYAESAKSTHAVSFRLEATRGRNEKIVKASSIASRQGEEKKEQSRPAHAAPILEDRDTN